MALPAVLHDFDVSLNHVDKGVEQRLHLKVPRHPSETVERLWLRVLAHCWLYEERLAFGPGLSDPDAPDLLATDLTGRTSLWVRVGKADPAKVQRAADQHADARVVLVFESTPRRDQFLEAARGMSRLGRVELATAPAEMLQHLARFDERRMKLGVTIVEDHLYLALPSEHIDGAIERGPSL